MSQYQPALLYHQQLDKHKTALERLLKRRSLLGWTRFMIFILTAIVSYYVFVYAGLWGIIALVSGISLLLFTVSLDINNNDAIANTRTLIAVNEEELRILNHEFYQRHDGSEFIPALHDYAHDLDLFGKASLIQWINRCRSEQGMSLLAEDLLKPVAGTLIQERQDAVKELATQLDWRQQLQSFSMQTMITSGTEKRTGLWLEEEERFFRNPGWRVFVNLYSLITCATAVAAILGYIPGSVFIFLYLLFFTTAIILSRNTIRPYLMLSGIVKEIGTLHQLIKWIGQHDFRSALLNRLKKESSPTTAGAAKEIRELKAILDRFDLRLNIAGLLFFNTFLLWDVRQMMALNEWRKRNRNHVSRWFHLVAEAEVLHSLASLHFNHPQWAFPIFSSEHFTLEAKHCGHPLIPGSQRVSNDFIISGTGKIALITGSNMAGKSTFLRSLGVNMVLAGLGAPVCAKMLCLSPSRLMTSMRISDNLAENTSTFYAELKKLKSVLEAVQRGERIFILLDEILRGTNSYDRHSGSKALIRQLIKHKAVAVIATHDVELAALEEELRDSIENYHFDVTVEGEELYFDYRLKEGVCTSLNASILMKKIGIKLDE